MNLDFFINYKKFKQKPLLFKRNYIGDIYLSSEDKKCTKSLKNALKIDLLVAINIMNMIFKGNEDIYL